MCDGNGRLVRIALTEGQRSEYDGACVLLADLAVAKQLPADTAYDADWFGDTLVKRKIRVRIPAGVKRSYLAIHDVLLHQQRHKSENTFRRLKEEWRRAAMRAVRLPCCLPSVVPLRVFFGSKQCVLTLGLCVGVQFCLP